MAEARRVEFQTITAPKEEKKPNERTLIPRFNLQLGESTATTCPEFSFSDLLKKEKVAKEAEVAKAFGDEDDCHDEVAALARKYEEKYGPKPGGKKRQRKCLEDDYYDLGDGYDENDPFIDNTEAYDEVVPRCLTTQYGGFYINKGPLDFRTQSDQDDSAAEFSIPVVRKRGRPRKIVDSEDSHDDGGEEVKIKKLKKKGRDGIDGEQKRKRRKLTLGVEVDKVVNRRKIDPDKKKKMSPTVKELLKHQTASTATISTLNGSSPHHHTPTSPHPPTHSPTAGDSRSDLMDGSDMATKHEGEEKTVLETEVQLPSDLPSDLAVAIVHIKKAAKDSKEGKCKFFSPHVNKLLLDIELASRQLSAGRRPLIYAHLAEHLPCGKETLIKRAKKLRENQQDDQLKVPIQHLKQEIDKVMPALQEQHDKDVSRARLENKEKRDGGEGFKEEGGVNTESDDDDKSSAPSHNTEGQPSRKGNRDPRKKFKWTPEIKSILCEIVHIKMRMFDTYKFRNQTAEEYLKTFLDNEIRVLWPQGWIQTRMLFKETRSVHGSWTNPAKPKRQGLMSRLAASPTPNSPSVSTHTGLIECATSPSAPPSISTAASGVEQDVIEVSDIDEPLFPASSKDRGRTGAGPDGLSRQSGSSNSNLKFSPNSMETVAAATTAVMAAAPIVSSSSRMESGFPSLGERRPHLMTEIMKRPGSTEVSSAPPPSSFPRPPPPSSSSSTPLPKTPPVSSGETFMAEFSRYLSSSGSTLPGPPSPTSPSSAPPTPQLQSRMVTSTTAAGRLPDAAHTPSAVWKVDDGSGGAERLRKVQQASDVVSPSGPRVARPVAHAHKGAPASVADLSQQQYKLMTSVLMGGGGAVKTKGEVVRDQIFAKVQAELQAFKARGGTPLPPSTSPSSSPRQPPPAHSSSSPSPPCKAGGNNSAAGISSPSPPSKAGGNNSAAGISRPSPPSKAGGNNSAAGISRPSPSSSSSPSLNVPRSLAGSAAMLRHPAPAAMPYVPKQAGGAVNTATTTTSLLSSAVVSLTRATPSLMGSKLSVSKKTVGRPSPANSAVQQQALGTQSPKTAGRPSPASLTRSGEMGVGVRSGGGVVAVGSGIGAQSLPTTPFHSQHSSSSPSPIPSHPPSAAAHQSVSVRLLNPSAVSGQKKPLPPPPHTPTSTRPSQRPPSLPISQPIDRVTATNAGQGQRLKSPTVAGQSQMTSPVARTTQQLPRSSLSAAVTMAAVTAAAGVPMRSLPSHQPQAVGSLVKGHGVGTSSGPGRPAASTAAAMGIHSRTGVVGQRSQGDKAASSSQGSLAVQTGSTKTAGSTAHSRPAPHPQAGPAPRLPQPTAGKVMVGKAPVTHSEISPQPRSLNPQAVDSPKPPPGFNQ